MQPFNMPLSSFLQFSIKRKKEISWEALNPHIDCDFSTDYRPCKFY